MKSKLLIALLVVLVSFLMFGPASASQPGSESDLSNFPVGTTIYVDPSNNSGMEDGTSTYPFNTIQEAVDAAGSDDLVGAAPGIYYEHVQLRAGVELVGTDPATTIIDGGGTGTVVIMEDASLLQGFTIQHGTASFGAGIVTRGSPTIKNNIIQNNAQTAGGAGAAIFGNVSSPLIANNRIRGNTADTQFLSGAISFINASSPFIVNNIITDNTGRGAINLTVPEGNQPAVVNNTIANNVGAGLRINSLVTQFGILVADNIVVGNSTGIQIDFQSAAYLPRFEFNDVYGNSVDYVGMSDRTGTDGNISVDPIFSTGFHLGYGSPLVDAGSVNYYPSYDFDGDARPLDGNGDGIAISDIGADERVITDNIPPVITAAAIKQDGTAYVADTWTNQTVTVKFTCSDESGVASCPADQVFEAEGIIPQVDGTATDIAGNSSNVRFGPIKIDKTPPQLYVAVSPNPVLLNGNAELLQNATDNLSGIHSGPCSNVDTSSVGFKSVTCWIMDNARNSISVTVPYQVIYDFEGFFSPIIDCVNNPCESFDLSMIKAGSTVPFKFQLRDANGNTVRAATEPLWLEPIRFDSPPPEWRPGDYELQVTNSPFQWKKGQNQYVYDWSTKGLPVPTIWLVGVRLDDGTTYSVFIALLK